MNFHQFSLSLRQRRGSGGSPAWPSGQMVTERRFKFHSDRELMLFVVAPRSEMLYSLPSVVNIISYKELLSQLDC